MANVFDFLGDDRDWFMKSSWLVYTDLSGIRQYVGKTGNEKAIKMSPEYIDWYDNTGGSQTLYVKDIDKFGLAIDFSFMQVADSNALAIAFNTDWDQSNANYNYHFFGSEPNELREAEWRFVGRTRSDLDIIIVIRKGVITLNGDWASGAPGSYTEIPVTCSALQDTSITNHLRDLGYIMVQKKTSGS
jgi:hypothetical protein